MLNQFACMGRMAVTPVLERSAAGIPFCNFSVATDRNYTNKKGERATDFLSCVAWRGTAEFAAKYFTKGSLVALSGHLEQEVWKDKERNKRSRMIIVVDNLFFGETKQARLERENRQGGGAGMPEDGIPYTDADIPPEFQGGYGYPGEE